MPLELEVVSTAPKAFVIQNFLSHYEADFIIQQSKSKLHASSVGDSSAGIFQSGTRTSLNAWLSKDSSPTVTSIYNRAADLLQIQKEKLDRFQCAEDIQVVHYAEGQKYDSHHDWGVSGYPESRYITLLFYLTDQLSPDAGGETSFPLGAGGKGMKIHPGKGNAVLFYNLLEDGNADDLSLHGALPVIHGEKWLANLWIWDPKMH